MVRVESQQNFKEKKKTNKERTKNWTGDIYCDMQYCVLNDVQPVARSRSQSRHLKHEIRCSCFKRFRRLNLCKSNDESMFEWIHSRTSATQCDNGTTATATTTVTMSTGNNNDDYDEKGICWKSLLFSWMGQLILQNNQVIFKAKSVLSERHTPSRIIILIVWMCFLLVWLVGWLVDSSSFSSPSIVSCSFCLFHYYYFS